MMDDRNTASVIILHASAARVLLFVYAVCFLICSPGRIDPDDIQVAEVETL